jgi:hypothetical protein
VSESPPAEKDKPIAEHKINLAPRAFGFIPETRIISVIKTPKRLSKTYEK